MSTSDSKTPFLDSEKYDWSKPEALELYGIMLHAYTSPQSAEMALAKVGIDGGDVNFAQPPRHFWKQALEATAAAGRIRRLAENARVDPKIAGYRPRLDRLMGGSPILEESPAPTEKPIAWTGRELLTGKQETFLEMSFLHEGLRVAASVVRLGTVVRSGESFQATGFLIAPDTILTNHHVLYDDDGARVQQVDIWFNYELDRAGRPRDVEPYEGDVETIVGDESHDWAIVRTKTPFKNTYPVFKLRPSKPVAKGDFVFIIQHPGGRPKKIGLLHNEVVSVTADRIQYLTDTLPGSSGSPVCNQFWEVVALHHKGIEGSDQGKPCKNQGININRVIEGLAAQGIDLNSTAKEAAS